jgi:hypothetical protein
MALLEKMLRRGGKRMNSRRKSRGQSFVEFAVLLPVLLIMISGLIEFGFALNVYLDLIDTAREVARFLADDDPVHDVNGNVWVIPMAPNGDPEPKGFYDRGWNVAFLVLTQAGQVTLDPTRDDFIVSIFAVDNGSIVNRFPPPYVDGFGCAQGGENGWRFHCRKTSGLTSADVQSRIALTASIPPDTGVVAVEVYHDYDMVMALPWITMFVPNPITLHAYSLMPNRAATP